MKIQSINLLREFIREQVARADRVGASTGMRTVDTTPYTFEDYPGYNIDITADVNGEYMLTIKHKGKKISPVSVYHDYDEAYHQARMVIDRHRVGDTQLSA